MFRFRKRLDPIAGVYVLVAVLLGCAALIHVLGNDPGSAIASAAAGVAFVLLALMMQAHP
jgi:protein-S-isoprenylcysteine O-methyltransferase Ste14